MKKITVYTTSICPYCVRAKALLDRKGYAYKEINAEDINEEMISNYSCVPEDKIDLLIRTGGDKRISNFLLYQIAYAEICFVEKFWPDFDKDDFIDCINNFKKVSRRFGARV